jgi:benzoyl-CoA reductase/2-hydroxyglutaryl-CoA dehydratase subunit BcrC/BadD/HgdB
MIESAKACNAAGAICHTAKFCDPYLARLPFIREVFRKEGMPLLVLEGDCTMRSMGQHRTRIEAFIEMLG